ncbi:MAG: Orotidine 5-phosphate decarboxylase [Actinomycetota bacterium]
MVAGLGSRFTEIRDTVGPLCVGIDPSNEVLSTWGLPDSAAGALEMGRAVIDAASTRIGIIKPQVAFFERFGAAGFMALETVISEARRAGLAVIADAKRGDIGSTMAAYAAAWLSEGPLHSDALTASPYQGFDALEPAFDLADSNGSTVFVLCATSNPDAATIQGTAADGDSLPSIVASLARARNHRGNAVGLVVGATRSLTESGLTVADIEGTLILAPGFGAQGAQLTDLDGIFGAAAHTVIPSVSRSVLGAGASGIAAAMDDHRRELGL